MTVEILTEKPLGLRICSDERDLEALTAEVNRLVPCGTTHGWILSERPEVAPVTCEGDPTRTHYVFDC